MDLVWTWYGLGMDLVWTWYGVGMELVWTWYGLGMEFVIIKREENRTKYLQRL